MSVEAMAFVWKLKLPHDEKFVLLAYADNANDNGGNIFPALLTVAKKTGYSKRSVQDITKKLETHGFLVRNGKSKHATTLWRIPMAEIAMAEQNQPSMSQSATPSMLQTATKPSLTTNQPSIEEDDDLIKRTDILSKLYQESFGAVTALVKNLLRNVAISYPDQSWYAPAFEVAAKNNGRSLSYVEKILENWKRDGKPKNGKKPQLSIEEKIRRFVEA